MNPELSHFAASLRSLRTATKGGIAQGLCPETDFNSLALELFALQFKHNPAYQTLCEARGRTPQTVEHWTQIPAVPTAAFKELELTSLAPAGRTAVFHSSGTTEQKPSRHFHSAESLALYEASLWSWFEQNVIGARGAGRGAAGDLKSEISDFKLVVLTPSQEQVPHSSLVHMFETVRQKLGAEKSVFFGKLAEDGAWTLDFDAALASLSSRAPRPAPRALLLLGTAFSFVHLLDCLAERDLRLKLPAGSRVMETGGYKNRSRTMPKAELHALITERLGIPPENIVCEYGMSELSSQAYDGARPSPGAATLNLQAPDDMPMPVGDRALLRPGRAHSGVFHFPPWARVQIVSPETGREVGEGEWGLIRVFDLANVFSVAAIQTEDLAVRRGGGFELIGRATQAEPRGCSLMSVESLNR